MAKAKELQYEHQWIVLLCSYLIK